MPAMTSFSLSVCLSLSLSLSLSDYAFFYILIVGLQSYCCICSHSITHTHSVGLIWTSIGHSQRPLPDNTQHSQETDIHAPSGIRTRNPSKRTVADRRLRQRGQREARISVSQNSASQNYSKSSQNSEDNCAWPQANVS
jgi:hypothetical protein